MNDGTFINKIGFSVFCIYMSVAFPLSVIPVFVKIHLDLSNVEAGLSVGAVFLATLLTRSLAGYYSDRNGGRQAAKVGVVLYAIGNVLCLSATLLNAQYIFFVIIIGRVIIGIGESFAILGFNTWGIYKLGSQFTGRVTGMVGMAMYGALMVGTPLGLEIYYRWGYPTVMFIALLFPFISLIILRKEVENRQVRSSRFYIFPSYRKILLPGTIVCLQGIGFAAISAFITLYFVNQNWGYTIFGLTAFGLGFVLIRLTLSHLPDKIGGYRVALIALIVEGIGQFVIYGSTTIAVALVGAFVTGLGCSIIMPSMGVETIRAVNADERGRALGGLSSFQDLAYGLTGPLAGMLVSPFGYSSVFFLGGIAASLGALMLIPYVIRKFRLREQNV